MANFVAHLFLVHLMGIELHWLSLKSMAKLFEILGGRAMLTFTSKRVKCYSWWLVGWLNRSNKSSVKTVTVLVY